MPKGLTDKLRRYGELSEDDGEALSAVVASVRRFAAGEEIAAEGDRSDYCHILLDGQAFRQRTLEDGRRQIFSFLSQGDLADLQGLFLPMDHGVTALIRCEAALVPHARLREIMQVRPAISDVLWRASLIEAGIFRAWLVGMGRRTAFARIAHLFCEIYSQQKAMGLAQGARCQFPVNQQHISDSLGLSTVHTNRTLQALRASGLLSFRSGVLTVLDWPGLAAAGEFDPGYLNLDLAA